MATATTGRLRITFQVQELLPEGEDPAVGRNTTFGDEIDVQDIKDFFTRCGLAVDTLYKGVIRSKVIRFSSQPKNRINAIKVIRQLACIGLKEAKDLVEAPLGSALVFFPDGRDADKHLATFRSNAVHEVIASECDRADIMTSVPQYVPEAQR